MSDAQAHMLLSSSPAPTEVSNTAHITSYTRPAPFSCSSLSLCCQGTAGEDAPDSLSPEDGESTVINA